MANKFVKAFVVEQNTLLHTLYGAVDQSLLTLQATDCEEVAAQKQQWH